jgi:hypothetical protein
MSTDELLAEALRLTRADRARMAEELLSSLEESDGEARAEVRSAALWYDVRCSGLGDEFIAEVTATLLSDSRDSP